MKASTQKLFLHVKKTLSLALVLALLFGIAAPVSVFADESPAHDNEIYAMLYYVDESRYTDEGRVTEVKNIEMVLQKGNQPDRSRKLVTDSSGKQGILAFTKVDAYPSWYHFAPTANNANIVKVDFKDRLLPTSIAGWFRNCKLLTDENILHKENLDTSECTDMQYAFFLCSGLTKIDFTQWSRFTADKVRKLSYFLSDCTAIKTADLTPLHPAACTEATYVFKNCYALEKVILDDFCITKNISGKAYMNNFFMNCRKLETVGGSPDDSVNLTEFRATKPMSYDSMFRGCTSLRVADLRLLGTYNTNKAVYISNMFYDCTSLESIDMTEFEIEFSPRNFLVNCRALRELKVPDAVTTNNLGKNESRDLFKYADKLAYVELSSAWKQNAQLTYLPAKTQWKKIKGDTADCPVGTTKTAQKLFKDFQTAYAGGWSAEDTIEFRGNGGSPDSQERTGAKGSTLTNDLTEPTREGYIFKGWYSKPDGSGDKFEGTADHWTYYAKWEDTTYTLTLNANGGHKRDSNVDITSQTLRYSQWIKLGDNDFVKDNKVLVGWNTNADGTGAAYSTLDDIGMLTPSGGELTLYAMWGENAATVTFDAQEGSAVSPKAYTELPADFGLLSESMRRGYTFMGWFTEETGGVKIEENTPVTGDCTLYAHWEKNPVVTLNANGGYFTSSQTQAQVETDTRECAYGGTVGFLPTPGHASASLIGWFTAKVDGEQIDANTRVTANATYYAHWGYRPELDTDGGVIQGSFEGFRAADSSRNYVIEALPDITRDNYTFDGWYHGETKVEEGDAIDLSNDKLLKAKWTPHEKVTITLDPNSGTLPDNESSTITIYSGNAVAALPTPTREGYDFDGWFEPNSDTRVTADKKFSADTTLTARWTERTLTVTFHAGKGTLLGDETVKVAPNRALDYIPGIYYPAVGETFIGWYTVGSKEPLRQRTLITENRDYYPRWETLIQPDSDTGVNFLAQWENVSDSSVTDIGNYLIFHPRNNNQVTARLKVLVMMEGSELKPVPIGALTLKIPRYVFQDYQGKGVGTDNTAAMASDNYNMTSDANYYFFTNKKELKSVYDTFTIDYTVTPRQVKGGYEDENGQFQGDYYKNENIGVTLDINKSSYGKEKTTYTQTLGLEFHTQAFTTPSKSRSNVTLEWNESWGARPVDADEYFYVTWALISDHANTSSQRFKLLWDENTAGREGAVVYTSGAVGCGEDASGKWTGLRTNGRYTAYVVTKHRRDQASENETWKPVYNEAVLNVEWESGHREQYRVSASATAYIPPKGSGAVSFTKTVPNSNSNAAHYIHGGQELILNGEADNMPKLPYEIKYTESYNVDNPTWNPTTLMYGAPERTMTLTDCADRNSNDVMISSCAPDKLSSDSWDNAVSHSLGDGDYYFDKLTIALTEYDAMKIDDTHWSNPYVHANRNDYQPVEIYVRKQGKNDFEHHGTVSFVPEEGITVALPEKTAGFKLEHKTTAYTASLTVKTNICLCPADGMIRYVANDAVANGKYTIIKNKATMEIAPKDHDARTYRTESNGPWPASYVLDLSAIHLFARKDCTDTEEDITFDQETRTESFPAVISGWNYNNSGNKTPLRSGEFYDLLPKEFSVDKDSVFVKPIRENWSEAYYQNTAKIKANQYNSAKQSDTLPKGAYSVSFAKNWENTGRTMMIVRVSVPDSILATGVHVYYKMKARYTSIFVNGVTQNNIVVFRDNTQNQIKPESKSTGIDEGDVPAELRSHFVQFDGDHTAFASDNTFSVEPPVRESGLKTAVFTEESAMTEHETVGLNTDYSYDITYSSGANAPCQKLVFYNVLEHRIDGLQSEWEGTFLGIDVSTLETVANAENQNANCAPVVYYSVAPKSSFIKKPFGDESDSFNLDLSENQDLWTTTPPDDLSTVTAVAVDCRKDNKGQPFVLAAESTLDFKINMQSESNMRYNNTYAYNETIIRFNLADKGELSDRVHLVSNTDVLLHFNTPQLGKTAFPSSGTSEAPASVVRDSVLRYTLQITNPDAEVTMNDVRLSDSFDASMVTVQTDNITVRLGDEPEALLPRHVRIKTYSVITENGATTFDAAIGTLEPNETLTITIPVKVIGNKDDVIVNTAQITEVNGVLFNVTSPTTYHKIDTLKLRVSKVNSKGEPLAGAALQILNKDGTAVVKSFTSAAAPAVFDMTEDSYILRETQAPSGYKAAADIPFRLSSDGSVYIGSKAYDAVTMVNEPAYKVIFHENNPNLEDKNVVFKTVESTELGADLKIPHFYDIPAWADDEYVFSGWYYAEGFSADAANAGTPVNFEEQTYPRSGETDPQDYHLYAKWIEVGKVEKDSADANIISGYRGFGLSGVQIRQAKGPNGETMYDPNERDPGVDGDEYNNSQKPTPAGMRFVTSLGERLLAEINGIQKISGANNTFGVEYGYVVGKEEDTQAFLDYYKPTDAERNAYKLQYCGENVNGKNTTVAKSGLDTDFRYITNVNCTSKQGTTKNTGIVQWDHRNFDAYRLYTLVVTYEGEDAANKDKKLNARAYLRYYDANGKLRVFYNTYKQNRYYGGCLCSFNQAAGR